MDLTGLPDDTFDSPGMDLGGLPDTNAGVLRKQYRATQTAPDEAAQVLDLSKRTGLPPPVVQRNKQVAQKQAMEPDWTDLETSAPLTVRELAGNAKLFELAHDDTENLRGIENALNYSEGKIGGPAFKRQPELKEVERTFGGTVGDIAVTGLKGAVGLPQAFLGLADIPTFGMAGKGLDAVGFRFTETQRILEDMYSPAQQRANREVRAADGFLDTLGAAVSNPSAIATTVGESLPQMLGGAAVARGLLRVAPSLSPLFAGAAGEGVVGAGSAAEQTRAGTDDSELTAKQSAAAVASGVGTAVFALMGGKLAQRLGVDDVDTALARGGIDRDTAETVRKGFVRRMAEGGISEGVFEELPQSAQEQIWQNFAADNPLLDGVANASAMGLLAGAVTGGGFSALVGASPEMQQAQVKAQAAERDAQALQQLAQLAAASKLRQRDPQTFQDFVEAANEDGAVQDLYLDARTLQQSGVDLAALAQAAPTVAQQLNEALATGGDVVIPVSEYAAKIAGTEFDTALLPYLRTSEDAISISEIPAAEEQARLFQETAAKVMEERAQDTEWQQSAKAVEAEMFKQLQSAGRFTDDVNTAYSTLMRDFYVATASRLGITPQEMFARYPLQVRADSAGGANVMEQEKAIHPFDGGRHLYAKRLDNGVWKPVYADGSPIEEAPDFDNGGAATNWLRQNQAKFPTAGETPASEEQPANPLQRMMQSITQALGMQPEQPAAQPVESVGPALDMGQFFNQPNQTGNRGEIAFGRDITQTPSVITLFQHADLSTFLHEMGHFQLEVLASIASQPNAPAEIAQDMEAVLKWFGVADLDTWRAMSLEEKRPYHEQFARGFEAYLFEGKAPSIELGSLFARFRSWLVNVYKSIKALNVEINDELRGVFDRMVATDESIKQAEAARNYGGLFKSPEEMGATPEEWAEYQSTAAEATQSAVDDLQKRSLRDMRWLTNARGRILKEMQRDAAAKRRAVEEEVRAEVRATPVYAAQRFIRYGELAEAERNNEQRRVATEAGMGSTKLDLAALKEMYGEGTAAPWRYLPTGKAGLAGTDGMAPDLVAELFGFTSGDHLVREILAAAPEAEMIEGTADQRVLERYGDLADPDTLARAVDEAIHNENRLKVLATELKAATKAPGPVRAVMQAAKQYAEKVLAGKKLKDIKPRHHAAAEARAGKAAMQAFGKGDTATLATEKRNQVLQGYLTKMSYEALDEVEKTRDFFKRVISGKDDQVVKTRDLDVVNAARAILASYGFGQKAKTAAEYLKAVQSYDPAMYDVLKARVDAAAAGAKPFTELTLEEMRGLRDEIDAMWYLAKRNRQMEVDGDLLDRQEVEAALRARMEEKGIPDKVAGEGSAITPAEERLRKLQTAKAAARRVESWVESMDGSEKTGPFWRYLWNTIKDPANNYRAEKAKVLKTLREAFDEIPDMKRGLIDAPELGYTFGKDEGGVGMSELMHALLHVGNASNKRKLLLGRNWATENADGTLDTSRWDAFIDRMHREGRITKAHYDARQKIWDTLESLKAGAQKAHRDVFGKYFAEVTAEAQETPFGAYRGGYVPAVADTRIVNDAALRKLAEQENENMAYAFPATSKGFTKSRTEYNRPLLLDLRTLAQHVDKVLLFSHLEQPVRDVRRVLMSKEVSYGLTRIDPAAYDGMLIPWLNRTAKQQVEAPIPGDRGLLRAVSVLRQRAGMAAMFANVSNTVQQVTGLSIAAIKVKPRYLLGAMAEYTKAPKAVSQTVAEASPYMATRMENEVAQMIDGINDILLDPTLYENAKAWAAKHTYFLQSAVDNVISPVVWLGAYNEAIEQGATEADARRTADGVVRQTQGSTQPEDVSRIETGQAWWRLFAQFAGYFNMQANVLGTRYAQTVEEFGVRKGAGRMLYITVFGFLAPAWVAEAIAQAFRGGPDDEDDDGYLDDWLMAVFGFGTLRNATAMIPVVGQGVNAAVNAANSKPYDDRMGTAPAISMIESAVRAPASVYKAVTDDASKQKAVRDVATLITLTTGLPAATLARPVGYGVGVAAGEIKPENEADFARGLVSGAKGPQ